MSAKIKSLLTSRRFWVSAIGVVTVSSAELFGVHLDDQQILSVASIVVAWVIGDTIRETA